MYFNGMTSPEEIKTEYRRLCFIHHPDVGGDKETMQQINAEYHQALQQANGFQTSGDDGERHRYHYNAPIEQAIMDMISDLLSLQMDGVEIWLIGTWLWVAGNTKPYRKLLGREGLGCSWHTKRHMWYWKPYKGRTRYSNASFGSLAMKYGARKIAGDDEDLVA